MKHTHKYKSYNCADGAGKYLYQLWKDEKAERNLPKKCRWRTIALAINMKFEYEHQALMRGESV